MTAIEDIKVHYVETLEHAQEFLRWLGERRPVLAIDTETTGLQWWTPNFLRLVQFGDGEQGWALSARDWRGVIRRALSEVVDSGAAVVMHNAPFDQHALESDGLPVPSWHRVHDTKVMDHLLDPLRPHGLKPLCDRLFGPKASAGQGMLKAAMSRNGWNWATVPEDLPVYWAYAALDTVLTAKAAEHHWPLVANNTELRAAYDREMAAQAILFRAERRGMRIDNAYTAALRQDWQAEIQTLALELKELGIDNPNANRQIEQALKDAGWEPEEFTPTGAAKLDKVILADLSRHVGAEVAPRVLRYKRLVKWTSAYLDHFLGAQDADGRVHASINTMAAKTGRMSITSPPLQTLPRGPEIRDCIIPDEGSRLLAVDYDSMEFRVFAHYAQEPAMQAAIRDGIDPHRFVAGLAYGIDIDAVSPDQRQVTKNCVVPGTPVLCADLRWRPAEALEPGDLLYAFDEHASEGDHPRARVRRWAPSVVTDTGIAERPTVSVRLTSGKVLTSTPDHGWIIRRTRKEGAVWSTAADLRPGDRLLRYADVWSDNTSRDAGWVAGMFDGEGSVKPDGRCVSLAQNPGPTLMRVTDILGRLGVPYRTYREDSHRIIYRVQLSGRYADRLRFLGSVRPHRLIDVVRPTLGGGSFTPIEEDVVADVSGAGVQDVVLLGTSSKTYIADGFAAHNTSYGKMYGAGTRQIAKTAGISEGEAQSFVAAYEAALPGVVTFMRQVEAVGRMRLMQEGRAYVTTWGGRPMLAPEDGLYKLVNGLIQGSCADLFKEKIIELDAAGYGDHILLPVHDEIIFGVPEEDWDDVVPEVARIMAAETEFSVPLTVEPSKPLTRWGDKYDKAREMPPLRQRKDKAA